MNQILDIQNLKLRQITSYLILQHFRQLNVYSIVK